MKRRLFLALLPALFALSALVVGGSPVMASSADEGSASGWAEADVAPQKGELHVLHFKPNDHPTRVPARFTPARTRASATIEVNYTGFSPEAEAAFQAAVDLVEPLINSPQTIRVDATWTVLQSCVPGQGCILGAAGAANLRGLSFDGGDTIAVPEALADALLNEDLAPNNPDVVAQFNEGFASWYLGTDGEPDPSEVDFVTVVIHELFHGLGFFGSALVDDGVANGTSNLEECGGVEGQGCFGFGVEIPAGYDLFVDTPLGTPLVDYDNPSTELGDALQSGEVVFLGAGVVASNGGPAKLFAPSTFRRGSSYSHWDEESFPPGHRHSLMTPSVGNGEVIRDAGAALCLFEDILWDTNVTCAPFYADGFEQGDLTNWS